MLLMMMATWQEINQMWAAVNELYGGLSASTAMPSRWMWQLVNPTPEITIACNEGSPRCVSMSRSVMRSTILPEMTSGGTKKANQERPTWEKGD